MEEVKPAGDTYIHEGLKQVGFTHLLAIKITSVLTLWITTATTRNVNGLIVCLSLLQSNLFGFLSGLKIVQILCKSHAED